MIFPKISKINFIVLLYWLLLTYIIVALIFWYIKLEHQNQIITQQNIDLAMIENKDNFKQIEIIKENGENKRFQYFGEGIVFLFLIILVAIYLYKSIQKEWAFTKQQKNVLMALSHELKTPIATVQLNLETLIKRDLDKENQSILLHAALEENQRLSQLTNNFILSNQILSQHFKIYAQQIDFSNLCTEIMNRVQTQFKNQKFQYRIEPSIYIKGEPILLDILINNLLDNAIKYGCQNPIELLLQKKNKGIILSVLDNGIGIHQSEKRKIFRKFYRVGKEELRNAPGTGLGLFISQKIANLHFTKIKVENNQDQGSIFSIIFKN